MYSKIKLEQKQKEYYRNLAEENLLTDKEREKLYERTRRDVEKMKAEAERYRTASKELYEAAEDIASRLKDTEASTKKRHIIPAAPANNTIDYMEAKSGNFAQGRNFYKLFLILFIGSFAGVVIELIWCFIRHGYLESRSGLVYGPFNLVYGIGALVLTLALFKYRNKSAIYSFLGGFVTGSVVEYFCSFFQELLFGSTSWDYSHMPFNINGRICLLYSVFWGFLGIFWIKNIYPRIAELILRIPNKVGKCLVYVLLVFMLYNSAVSGIAVYRWKERVDGIPAANGFERFIDSRFPDARMQRIYANLKFS